MQKVSCIIPTFNRFKYLLNAIESIKKQTYQNIEIIVVNDCSTEQDYYDYNWSENGIIILHLPENTKKMFGFACAGYVRNKGIEISNGEYVAFCDDDDLWFPNKLELQINAMKETGCKMSCTEGILGIGMYNINNDFVTYNTQYSYKYTQKIHKDKGSHMFDNGYPKIWTLDFLNIHNCIVCSSVLLEKKILNRINNFQHVINGQEDYDCWKRTLEHTDCVYVEDICFYYDITHGNGQNY